MRKAMCCILLCTMCVSLLALPCAAAEITQPDGSATTDVFVKYTEQIDGEYQAALVDGSAEIRTEDGTVISVSGLPKDALTLVVCLITDTAAREWLSAQAGAFGTLLRPYEIYMINAKGERVPLTSGAAISISLPEGCASPIVVRVPSVGAAQSLAARTEKGSVHFTVGAEGFYVIAEKKTAPPQTGEDSHPVFWAAVLLLSALSAGALFTIDRIRRRKNSKK